MSRERIREAVVASERRRTRLRYRSTLPAKDAARHTVYYTTALVTYSMPCFEETRTPRVGMRLAMLNLAGEFSGTLPEERFYPGRIVEVERFREDDHWVTVEFDGTMGGHKSLTIGWNSFSKFCVPMPDHLKKLLRRP